MRCCPTLILYQIRFGFDFVKFNLGLNMDWARFCRNERKSVNCLWQGHKLRMIQYRNTYKTEIHIRGNKGWAKGA